MANAITTPENYQSMREYLRIGELAQRKGWPVGMLVKEVAGGTHVIHATGNKYDFTQADKDAVDWLIYKKGTGGGAY